MGLHAVEFRETWLGGLPVSVQFNDFVGCHPDFEVVSVAPINYGVLVVFLDRSDKSDDLLKPMTFEEAANDDCFLEYKNSHVIDAALNIMASYHDDPQPDDCIHYRTHEEDDLRLLRKNYNKTWRCWDRRPTYIEREAANWEK